MKLQIVAFYDDTDFHEHCAADRGVAGYDGPGWYFWDESWEHLHGPFATKREAEQALSYYVEEL